jgi:hypothetical protein
MSNQIREHVLYFGTATPFCFVTMVEYKIVCSFLHVCIVHSSELYCAQLSTVLYAAQNCIVHISELYCTQLRIVFYTAQHFIVHSSVLYCTQLSIVLYKAQHCIQPGLVFFMSALFQFWNNNFNTIAVFNVCTGETSSWINFLVIYCYLMMAKPINRKMLEKYREFTTFVTVAYICHSYVFNILWIICVQKSFYITAWFLN